MIASHYWLNGKQRISKPTYLIIERAVQLEEDYLVRVLFEGKPGVHLLMPPGPKDQHKSDRSGIYVGLT